MSPRSSIRSEEDSSQGKKKYHQFKLLIEIVFSKLIIRKIIPKNYGLMQKL